MKRYRFSWAMFIGAALSLGQPVWADDDKPPAGPNPEQIFKDLDKNSDGQLTAEEVGEDRKRFFERLVRVGDQNSDGKLSAEEFQKASRSDDRPVEAPRGNPGQERGDRPNFEERFKQLDTNGDGKVSREEVPEGVKQYLNPLFDRLGKNEITKEEFLKARGQLGGQGRPAGGDKGIPGGGAPEEFFKRLDTNNDGKLTLDEAPERGRPFVERLLQKAGKGNDGSVSREEFMAAASRFQGERRGDGERKPEDAPRDGGREERKPEGAPRDGDRRPEGAPRDGDKRRPEGGPRDGDSRRPEGAPRDGERGPEGAGRRPMPRFFEKIDANHDGRISADEFAKANEYFKDLDENGDGHLDPRELMGPPPGGPREGGMREGGDRGGRRPEMERPEGRGKDTGPREGRPAEGRRGDANAPAGARDGAPRGGGERLIKQFDKNGDGKISLEEAPERLKQNFARLDANGDGQIEANELPERGDFPAAGEGRGRRPDGDRPAKPEGGERPAGDKARD